MDNTSALSKSTCNTVTDIPHEISIVAKLRRLKIEENILSQCLYKLDKNLNETHAVDNPLTDYRIFLTKRRNSFADIKKTFQDVKICVSSQEMLKSTEISDIRGNILELENNIKSFKTSLQTDLLALKSSARQLHSDLCEGAIKVDNIMKSKKLKITKYNEIVPSPVKILMNSPFKCVEVEEFQKFMKNSLNHYGGWNEYNHHIFVNLWHTFFYPEKNGSWEKCELVHENSLTFQAFLEEVFSKLPGLETKDIISHTKWYLKYTILKQRQQEAIDKWRLNRERIKKSAKKYRKQNIMGNYKTNYAEMDEFRENKVSDDDKNQVQSLDNHSDLIRKCWSESSKQNKPTSNKILSYKKSTESVEILHFLRPTEQWTNRCNNKSKELIKHTNGLEYIEKLGTPKWRKGFKITIE